MTTLARRLTGGAVRQSFGLPFQEWTDFFKYQNVLYPVSPSQTLTGNREDIRGDFTGVIAGAYRSNGIVFACIAARMLHFQQARFQFQQMRAGTPGDLFGTGELGVLEVPWVNGTTGNLLARMLQDVDLAGNSYIVRDGDQLGRLRPDWVSILLASRTDRPDWEPGDPDTIAAGYAYKPGGPGSHTPERIYFPEQVAHFAPTPDPLANYRGISWLGALIREIQADSAMTSHRLKFMENGATVNMVVKVPAETLEVFNKWVDRLEENHRGLGNAYRTMYLAAGAEATPVGSNLQQMDFKSVQGAGEVRIATAARVPPTLLGISEGLQGSTLNAGNYQIVVRNFADGCIRPLWQEAAGALASIVAVPSGARLWYDDRHVAFLKEDVKDAADIQTAHVQSIHTLVAGGFTPESAVDAVVSGDLSRLKHTGVPSVQLQPAGNVTQGKGALVVGTPTGPTSNGTQPKPIPA